MKEKGSPNEKHNRSSTSFRTATSSGAARKSTTKSKKK
jgi:hypothetical protein